MINMGRNNYKCQWCNKDYWSYKPNSQFCSMDCKKQYRQQFQYHCDYCGVQFRVKPFQLRDLETGKHKHLYCSRECADKGQVTSVTLNCLHCGKEVLPMGKSSRNHCPFCLWSKHLDINPGDRASECRGLMEPISAEPDPKKGYVIIHKCTKCGAERNNKMQSDDDTALLIKLTNPYNLEEYE